MKAFLIVIGIAIIAIVLVVLFSTITNSSNNQANIERQYTERVLQQEQTKREAAALRAEQTNQTVNSLSLILGSIFAFGCIAIAIVFINDRFAKRRIYEMQEMGRQERMQIRELKQLEAMRALQPPQTQWYLTGKTIEQTPERKITIYEE